MRIFLLTLVLAATWPSFAADRPTVIVVVGAEGAPEYGSEFAKWADRWIAAANTGGANVIVIGRDGTKADRDSKTEIEDRDKLRQVFAAEVGTAPSTQPTTGPTSGPSTSSPSTRPADLPATQPSNLQPLWLVLIGHGTFDGREAKLNLRGTDVSDQELAAWLKPARRPLAVIDCTSASAPFLNRLSGINRIIIVATRSGQEQQYARFGDYLSTAVADPTADLDRDGQTSLLEAYIAASTRTEAFYKEAGRLSTEHALLDDNGDALGTPANWFDGIRATKSAKAGSTVDGHRAHQWHLVESPAERSMPVETRARRNELELQIQGLRDRKPTIPEAAYYAQLEPMLLELARVYASATTRPSRQE
ncbi:hypothetical protein [Humisphaera borealis]|uniref:Uncharacterized protein n=1 Tax=Humisphaera borealis TaxID=2807512 RepID=A0A7M2WS99_9BACT|nr:hypothetical protein [Humisphaera borealis]QOV88289.1 hypothetical protein IPV69_18825 [Humisphaera borealis]